MSERRLLWVPILLVGGLLASATPKAPGQTIWVVDAAGGGDFTDIPPSIAAASDGDLIEIRKGLYSDFSVDKSLTFAGQSNQVRAGAVSIQAAPGPVVLRDLKLQSLEVLDCDAAVVGDDLELGPGLLNTPDGGFSVRVEGSADVRLIDTEIRGWKALDGYAGLRVVDSRVELVDSSVVGASGKDVLCSQMPVGYGGDGGVGILIDGLSRVQTVETWVRGGNAGYLKPGILCPMGYAGDPGDGAEVRSGELIGVGGTYRGGNGGAGLGALATCSGGADGLAASAAAQVRESGVTFIRGAPGGGLCQAGQALAVVNPVASTVDDPTLTRSAEPVADAFVELQVAGRPGAVTRLFIGTVPQVLPKQNTFLELLLVKEQSISLGPLPASGAVTYQLDLTGYASGQALYAQAVSNYGAGEQRRTNSLPLVLR